MYICVRCIGLTSISTIWEMLRHTVCYFFPIYYEWQIIIQVYCINIEECCPEQYIMLHELVSAISYTARDNIPQYQCNNPFIIQYQIFQSVSFTFHHISLQYVFNIISLSLVCLRENIVLLGTSLVGTKNGMQYRSRCNIFNSFGNALLFMYIYKGKLVKISANIAFLFYKEIYMKYLILYYKVYNILFI